MKTNIKFPGGLVHNSKNSHSFWWESFYHIVHRSLAAWIDGCKSKERIKKKFGFPCLIRWRFQFEKVIFCMSFIQFLKIHFISWINACRQWKSKIDSTSFFFSLALFIFRRKFFVTVRENHHCCIENGSLNGTKFIVCLFCVWPF